MEESNKKENENINENKEGDFFPSEKRQVDLKGDKTIDLAKLLRRRRWSTILPNPYQRFLISLYKETGDHPKVFNNRLGDIHHIIQRVNPEVINISHYDTVIEADKTYEAEKAKVRRVFRRHRDIVPDAIGYVIKEEHLESYIHDGYSLEKCWSLIDTALGRHGIVPILSDRRDNYRYKIMDITTFIAHWEFIVRCGLSTIKNVAEAVRSSDEPLGGRISQKFVKLIADDNEHLVLDYPRRYICRFCKETLIGEDALDGHMETCNQKRL